MRLDISPFYWAVVLGATGWLSVLVLILLGGLIWQRFFS
jgi:hypothetical protein